LKDVLHVPTITKKIGLYRPDGGTRFIGDIQPKWMFCGRHEEPKLQKGKGMDECSP
jgi:hypothetical protein